MEQLTKVARSLPLILVCICMGCQLNGPVPNDFARAQTLQLLDVSESGNLSFRTRRKVAILCAGAPLQEVSADANKVTVKVLGSPGSQLQGALAVGIDKAGYFLTAAHMTNLPYLS